MWSRSGVSGIGRKMPCAVIRRLIWDLDKTPLEGLQVLRPKQQVPFTFDISFSTVTQRIHSRGYTFVRCQNGPIRDSLGFAEKKRAFSSRILCSTSIRNVPLT